MAACHGLPHILHAGSVLAHQGYGSQAQVLQVQVLLKGQLKPLHSLSAISCIKQNANGDPVANQLCLDAGNIIIRHPFCWTAK